MGDIKSVKGGTIEYQDSTGKVHNVTPKSDGTYLIQSSATQEELGQMQHADRMLEAMRSATPGQGVFSAQQPQQQPMVPAMSDQPAVQSDLQITTPPQIPRGIQNEIISGIKKEGKAMEAVAAAEIEKAGKLAEGMRQSMEGLDRVAAQQQAIAEKSQETFRQLQASIDEEVAKVRDFKIDPNRFYKEKSTGERILAGIAIGMGGLGGAISGSGKNLALEIINRAIERDIDAQKAEFEALKTGVAQKESLYGKMISLFGTESSARNALHQVYLENAKVRNDLISAQSSDPLIKANAQKQSAEIDQKIAEMRANLAAKTGDVVVSRMQSVPKSPSDRIKAANDLEERFNKNPIAKQHRIKKYNLIPAMEEAMKAGQPGAAAIQLIAEGYKQGSFGTDLDRIYRDMGLGDKIGDNIDNILRNKPLRERFITQAIQILKSETMQEEKSLMPFMQGIARDARAIGMDPKEFLVGVELPGAVWNKFSKGPADSKKKEVGGSGGGRF